MNMNNDGQRWSIKFPLKGGRTLSAIAGKGTYSSPREFLSSPWGYSHWEVAILDTNTHEFVKDGEMIPLDHPDTVNSVLVEDVQKWLERNQ